MNGIDCTTLGEGYCPKRDDETHCECWWDGEKPCCDCGYGGHAKHPTNQIEASERITATVAALRAENAALRKRLEAWRAKQDILNEDNKTKATIEAWVKRVNVVVKNLHDLGELSKETRI